MLFIQSIIPPKLNTLKTKRDFLFFFTFPIIIIAAISCVNIMLNFYKSFDQTKQSTELTLSAFSKHCEYKINSVINSASFLEINPYTLKILDNAANTAAEDFAAAKNALAKLKNSNPIIETAAILCKEKNTVITPDGEFTFENFFDENYILDAYPSSYFKNFRIYDSSNYRIIPPVSVTTPNKNTSTVSPILIRKMSQKHKNYVFISISMEKLLKSDMTSLNFTKNSEIFVLNSYSGKVFSPTDTDGINIFGTEIYNKLVKKMTSFKEKTEGGTSYYIFSYAPSKTIFGYIYYTKIPTRDLYNKYSFILLLTVFLTLVTVIYALRFSANISNGIYSSLNDISSSLKNRNEQNTALIPKILESVAEFKKEYSHILSYAQEKYIIEYMNSDSDTISQDAREQILNNLPFDKTYFICTIFKISPTDKLSMLLGKDSAKYTLSETFKLLKSIWLETTDCFFVSSEKNTLYVLINTNDISIETLIDEKCSYISSILKYDADLINLTIGKGTLEQGIEGLKKSHTAAINNMINVYSPLKLNVSSKTYKNGLSHQTESRLFLALINENCNEAMEIIEGEVNALYGNEQKLRNAYSEIIDIIFRVMRIKGINFTGEENQYETRYNIIKQPLDEIQNTIKSFVNEFSKINENEIDVNNILEYINDNFTNPLISLDFLSDEFNNDSKYLSALIKNKLGIGFHEYITNLRIDKAKVLLTTTGLSQQDILEQCGFTNRQTFSRVFKKTTGSTPSEYKRIHSKN